MKSFKRMMSSLRTAFYAFGTIALIITVAANGAAVNQINCGGSASSPYTADQYYSGGTAKTYTNTIDMSGVTNPAPQAVYQAERYGASTYTITGLTSGTQYVVRLHFCELYQTAAGARKFNVSINGTSVLSNFDIYATVNARYKALVREFTATANTSGQIIIAFTNVTDNATIEGIETYTLTAPAITTQPANQTVTSGATATFTVAATGAPSPTYQWRKNGTDISGATGASYTTPATASSDNGALYVVVVTNSVSSVTSSSATLTVNYAPAITTQPSNASVVVGSTATFTVAATGNPAPTYQWRKNGTNISGATSASYTTPATTTSDNGAVYSVVVTNSVNSVTSNNATLTVTAAPTAPVITTQPSNASVIVGATATFTVVATGNPTPTYQWRKNGTDISGATSASYTTPATTLSDNGAVYSVVVTNSVTSVTSNNATLTVTISYVYPNVCGANQNMKVDGRIKCTSLLINNWLLSQKGIPDYVFDKGYSLRDLDNVEQFVKANKHLPGVPSAEEVSRNGVDISEFNMALLKKIEELTLYMIEAKKEIAELKARLGKKEKGKE